MSAWVEAQVRRVSEATRTPVAVVLDPLGLLPDERLREVGELHSATTWWTLRCAWEAHGRRRSWDAGRAVIHVTGDAADLVRVPADVRHDADVVDVGRPVPLAWGTLLGATLADGRGDALIAAARAGYDDAQMLEHVFGVAVPRGRPAAELTAVALLRARPTLPDSAWALVATTVQAPLARALACQPPDVSALDGRWRRWLTGDDDAVIEEAAPALIGLAGAGLLSTPQAVGPRVPRWIRRLLPDADHTQAARELLERFPVEGTPAALEAWSAVARWTADIRAALSRAGEADETLRRDARARFEALDERFSPWLRANYGQLLQSAMTPPLTVNKVMPFIARRLRSVDRVLLVVLDGVGLAQWRLIREHVAIQVLQDQVCLAMLPTETAISRQALVGGETPDAFADTLTRTDAEGRRFRAFWRAEGLDDVEVRYHRVDGRMDEQVVLASVLRAVVVIVSAIDRFMHASTLLDDAQLVPQLEAWCRSGFLRRLLDDAAEHGYETWLTADHGNVVAAPGSAPREGLRVERAGTRFRLYRTREQRDAVRDLGIPWTPPRLPPDVHALFAPGRTGFHGGHLRVTHGGLSFEEVFVPLVRVT